MKRTHKLHPAVVANAETLRRAVRLKAENQATRRPLIYGVTAGGRAALIN